MNRDDEEQQDEFQIYTDDDLSAIIKNTLQGEIDVLKGIQISFIFTNYEFNSECIIFFQMHILKNREDTKCKSKSLSFGRVSSS